MVHTPRHGSEPLGLVRFKARWTERLKGVLDGTRKGNWATSAAQRILKDALTSLAHGKCAFCEGVLGAQAWLEVEHYVAKTVNAGLAFEWTNLFPACSICNVRKSNEDHGQRLLKPDSENPEPYFWINPDSGKLEPHPRLDAQGVARAELTVRVFDLQRGQLCVNRLRRMAEVRRWVERSQTAQGPEEVRRLKEEWDVLSDPGTEYKLASRHQLRLKGLEELADFDRSRFETAPENRTLG